MKESDKSFGSFVLCESLRLQLSSENLFLMTFFGTMSAMTGVYS